MATAEEWFENENSHDAYNLGDRRLRTYQQAADLAPARNEGTHLSIVHSADKKKAGQRWVAVPRGKVPFVSGRERMIFEAS